MAIHVGCSGMPVGRARYTGSLGALEVAFTQGVPPRASTARKWRQEVPEGFVYTVVAPSAISRAPDRLPPGLSGEVSDYGGLRPTDAVRALSGWTLEVAAALEARMLLFVTPPSIGPGPRGRDTVRRYFDAIGPGPDGLGYTWEPHGPWAEAELRSLAAELGLVLAVDPLRDPIPPGGVAYGRLGPFAAMGRALADDELEAIVEALEPHDEAYCFLDTDRAFDDARRLGALVAP